MHSLKYQIRQICKRNRDGSYATQADRKQVLLACAAELTELGYKVKSPFNFKPKHIYILVGQWLNSEKPLAIGTIKNRMAALRWLNEKCGTKFIQPSNAKYGIGRRTYIGKNKAVEFKDDVIARITNDRVRFSALLQKNFGLRREEAIKFNAHFADRGDYIFLKGSWTKGGRERNIPITTTAQRDLISQIKIKYGNSSLIAAHNSYAQQKELFWYHMNSVGYGASLKARHAYAQKRYKDLTGEILSQENGDVCEGLDCPHWGGLIPMLLPEHLRIVDRKARQILSRELGHNRIQICSVYLGG